MSSVQGVVDSSTGEPHDSSSLIGSVRSGRIHLDPRTKLLTLLVVNFLVLSGGGSVVAALSAVLVSVLLADVAWGRLWWVYVGVVVVSTVAFLVLPQVWSGMASAVVAAAGFWCARFAVSLGLAAAVVIGTPTGQLVSGLSRLRVPQVVIVPVEVVIRFIPAVVAEFRAIFDAMRMRGVFPSVGGAAAHPVRTSEYILVPLLASMTRMADELSASALLRGLGNTGPKTSVQKLGFGPGDCGMLGVLIALVIVQMMLPGTGR